MGGGRGGRQVGLVLLVVLVGLVGLAGLAGLVGLVGLAGLELVPVMVVTTVVVVVVVHSFTHPPRPTLASPPASPARPLETRPPCPPACSLARRLSRMFALEAWEGAAKAAYWEGQQPLGRLEGCRPPAWPAHLATRLRSRLLAVCPPCR